MRRLGWGVAVAIAFVVGGARADTAEIRVKLGKPGVRVSPMLYGIFFEEINHAGDGGLYAEMIRNGSFEDSATGREGWNAVGDAKLSLDSTHASHLGNPRVLRIEVVSANGGAGTDGFWGIALREGQRYRLQFRLLSLSTQSRPVRWRLEGAGGRILAEDTDVGSVQTWGEYRYMFTSRATDAAARLMLTSSRPGTLLLDNVSLKPVDTWKGHGLRSDLAEKLAGIRPAFVRFPGGCYCEGEVLKDAFRWKNSLGPIESRPGHWNLWGYRSTDGLGFQEYLQLCEDLGAEPLFVINCGMSHRENVPMDQLGPWIQDALDAIEYANGAATSKWGGLRARAGHPKPFNLKYMEIGNENGGPVYEEHFAAFYDAIKKQYPHMRLVANVPVRSRQPDIIDEHYYSNPQWFMNNAHRYDGYSRSGPRIYVGEYAVTQNCGTGNLRAALGEAAFMTGMERNADIVTMASYAPLFVNVHDRHWNPDAICYDNLRSYGTPSYWVQRMFSRSRIDEAFPIDVQVQEDPLAHDLAPNGGIGLGTWATQAEYKDVTVTGGNAGRWTADFGNGWRVVRGDWRAVKGAYRQASEATDVRSLGGEKAWSNYTLHLKARKLGGAEGFLIMFRVQDADNWFWWNIGGWGNREHAIEKCEGGAKSTLGSPVPGSVETGRWYDVRIELDNNRIRCYLDGKLIHDVRDQTPSPVAAVAGIDRKAGQIVLKVVNNAESAQETVIRLDGAGQVLPTGEAEVLTADSMDAENTLEQPKRVVPVKKRVTGLDRVFRYTFPPRSLTILQIRTAAKPARG